MSDDVGILGLFETCLSEAVSARREQTEVDSPFFDQGILSDTWVVCDDAYNGRLWRHMGQLPSWKSRPDDDAIFVAVESAATKLTDSRPRVGFVPREQSDYPTMKLIQAYFDAWWEWSKGALAIYLSVKDSQKFGTGWLHLEWSPSKKAQTLKSEHPEVVLVDPDCTIDDFDPSYVIYEYVARVGELKEAFPSAKWDDYQSQAMPSGFWQRILKRFSVNTSVKNPIKSATVYEFWIKDAATQEFDVYDGEIGVKVSKKKYPGGRVVTISGGIVLDDRPNPYRHGRFPFVPVACYPETGKFYGHGLVSRLIPIQVLNMRLDQYLFDATLKSTGGIYLVNKRFGLTKTSLTNDPVQIREVSDVNQALKVVQPPSPPRHMFDLGAKWSRARDDASGNHDISKGAYTPGNKTVAEVNIMAESDNTRTRMQARYLGIAIEQLGALWLSNVAQFEDKETIIRIAGDTDGQPESVEFNPAEVLRSDVIEDTEGTVVDWDMLPFDIKVADSSTLPARQQELAQQAMSLAQGQMIDRENLLEVLDWPDRKAMLARMAAAEAAAQAQPQPEANAPVEGEGVPEMGQGAPPPEVLAQVEQIAAEEGRDPQEVMAELMSQMQGV